ncbi:hypothetical protein AHAS_Ahas07G0177000 [Arachis hypogaea]
MMILESFPSVVVARVACLRNNDLWKKFEEEFGEAGSRVKFFKEYFALHWESKKRSMQPDFYALFRQEEILILLEIFYFFDYGWTIEPLNQSLDRIDGVAHVFEGMVPTRIASLSRFRLHQHMVSATNLDDHDDCERNNKRNDFRNSLIDKCKLGKLSNVGEAFDLFHSMAMMKPLPSVFDFTLLLGVIVRMKHYTTVISLVQYMYSSLGIKPDCFTLNIVINCLCRIKLTPFGFSVFASMLKLGLEPPLSTFTALINGLCMQGDVARAVGTLESLKSMGYQLDVYTYGALINGLCKMGDTNAAIEWLHKMEERDCRSNVVVHSTIIDSLCKDELVSEALNMFSEMCSKGIKPNIVTYSCLIQGLCNFGRWKDAASLLDEMMKVGMMPDLQTLNILVDVFCKDGKVMQAKSAIGFMILMGERPDALYL